MRKNISILLLIIVFGLSLHSCTHTGNTGLNDEAINKTDTCNSDAKHTYLVYIPPLKSKCKALPLTIIIDPHGNGKYAIENFKESAEKYPGILVASNLIRNNFGDYVNSLNELVNDVKKKYPVSDKLYLAGFSGGGRMVISYSMYYPVDGLIVCGALASAEQIKAVNCPVIALIGMDDFNFIEVAQYIFKPTSSPENLRIEFTNASHTWPQKRMLTDAMGYIQLSSEEINSCIDSKTLLTEYCKEQKLRVDSLTSIHEFLKAGLVARNMAMGNNFEDYYDFISLRRDLEYGSAFMAELEQLKESIRFELSVRSAYYGALQQEDSTWWENEIISLKANINSDRDVFRSMAYRRIKGFLGIMSYSLCNQFIKEDKMADMERILEVYRMLEPNNPDMFYFSAYLAQYNEKPDLAKAYLLKAKAAGFSDLHRLEQDFSGSHVGIFNDLDK